MRSRTKKAVLNRAAAGDGRRVEDSLYDILGRERIHALVTRFYDFMDTLPEAAAIRAMHPPDLASSREKLELFLVGWSGGPPLYVERFGHPRLRARHLPFPIGNDEAWQWMHCMRKALAEVIPEPHQRSLLESAFGRIAMHMRNAQDELATD